MSFTPYSFRKSAVATLIAASLSLFSVQASAYYLFNVDMTSLSPSPVYDSVILDYKIAGNTFVGCSMYGEHNLVSFVDGCAGTDFHYAYTQAAITDGIFSFVLSYEEFAFLVEPIKVVGVKNGVSTAALILLDVSTVPEPATLGLLGTALAGLVVVRRSRQHHPV